MSTPPNLVKEGTAPPSDVVNVEVDGKTCQGKKGQMIIHVTDAQNAYVPRFCYHDKLPIAANCRMCLVEVEKAPKPLPACATPITEGMKIFTKSPKAIGAQKATMEFLLINHPLDCPICDQGGECELQDLAMGFGRDISRFNERKRVVKDKDLGPLVSTDMTRCIHCTRCVRFTSEIAGFQELGTTGRGEDMEIGTYIERAVEHELSGNIIDLCPVGALNSKPFRYRARSWEMTQAALVSPHDGVGTNIYGHVLRGRLMRVVPRTNEAVNETWIADRDRYSYEGIYSADRVEAPMVREAGEWKRVTWEVALETAARGLKAAGAGLATLASASATVEELYLLSRLTRGLGSNNIDHRLRQADFRDQAADPAAPGLGGLSIAGIDQLDALLVVGSNLRREAPVLAHRVRKAAKRGAKVAFVNPARFEYLFPVSAYLESGPAKQLGDLAAVYAAVLDGAAAPAHLASLVTGAEVNTAHRSIAAVLKSGAKRAIWLGALALRHPAYADLRAVAAGLAAATGATLGTLAEGGNAAGAYLAGAIPHRDPGGIKSATPGKNARDMLAAPHEAYLLFGGTEPWADGLGVEAVRTLGSASFVVAATPFADETLKSVAHVLLPISTFVETSGTYVNLEGLWQSFAGAAKPLGEARPGWKVLRVLGNLAQVSDFDYQSSEEVREELRARCADIAAASYQGSHQPVLSKNATAGELRVADVPMYAVDAVLRRAPSLQRTREGKSAVAMYGGLGRMNYLLQQWQALPDWARSTAWILVVTVTLILSVAFTTLWERKVIGWMQLRRGPNRVGSIFGFLPGIFQPFADVIKLLIKEVIIPAESNKVLFRLAPMITLIPAFAIWAVIPLDPNLVIADVNAGLLYVLALTSVGVYGVILAGWASNSKYAFLGAMRSAAQIVAYEIAMGFALVGVIMAAGSLNLGDITRGQGGGFWYWNFVWLFPLFLVYFISGVAETNRAPFDVAEGESEIVAGFHVEYSGIAFALFFLAEYANMLLISTLTAVFFFGGWLSPMDGWFEPTDVPAWLANVPVLGWVATRFVGDGFHWLFLKLFFFLFCFLWFRATFPRYRYDQIMRLGWKILIPITIVWIAVEGVLVYLKVGPWRVS